MFDFTDTDLITIYEDLKNKFDLTLTTTSSLNDGFTDDCPINVGKAHRQVL